MGFTGRRRRIEAGNSFQVVDGSLLTKFSKLPDNQVVPKNTDRVLLFRLLLDSGEQIEEMTPDLLRVRRLFPNFPTVASGVDQDGPDRNRILLWGPVRVIAAVGVGRIRDVEIPNLAIRRFLRPDVRVACFAVIYTVEPTC